MGLDCALNTEFGLCRGYREKSFVQTFKRRLSGKLEGFRQLGSGNVVSCSDLSAVLICLF